MSSTTLRPALRSLLRVLALALFVAAPGMRADETDLFRRSVADIMAGAGRTGPGAGLGRPSLRARRQHLGGRPESPRAAASPAGLGAPAPEAPAAPQTIGVNFRGATLADTDAFPPDTSGAAGPTQFLVGVNGRIRTFLKATGVADGVLDSPMDAFFESVRNGNPTGAPHVRYDRLSSRWIVAINNFNASFTNNRVLLAVTDAASAGVISNTTVWTYFYFQHDLVLPAGDTDTFFDAPSLGVDANGLTIGGNIFDDAGVYLGTTVHVIRKSRALSGPGGDLVPSGDVVAFRNLTTTPDGTGPYAPQGVNDLHDAASTKSWIVGVDNAGFGALVFRSIAYSSTGAWPPSGISANISAGGAGDVASSQRPSSGQRLRRRRSARRGRRPPLRGQPAERAHLDRAQHLGRYRRRVAGRSQRIALVRDRRLRRRPRADAGRDALRFGGDQPSLLLDSGDRRLGAGPRRDGHERLRRDPEDQRGDGRAPGRATRSARCRPRCSTRRAPSATTRPATPDRRAAGATTRSPAWTPRTT